VRGYKHYEFSNHLGNVLVVISDKRITICGGDTVVGYNTDVISANDYYPFGMLMPGKVYSCAAYRFGYQGSEKDDEIASGFESTFCRELDTRLCRWWALDPKVSPFVSPYASMNNNPIWFNDQMGDTIRIMFGGFLRLFQKTVTYRDGKFIDKKGNEISTGNKFYNRMNEAIKEINSGQDGKELFDELSKSKFNFVIRNSGWNHFDNGEFKSSNNKDATTLGTGSGGNIWMDPRRSKDGDPFYITLAHEMGHALSSNYGSDNIKTWFKIGIYEFRYDEQVGMFYENLVRQEHHLPQRMYYYPEGKLGPRSETHEATQLR